MMKITLDNETKTSSKW